MKFLSAISLALVVTLASSFSFASPFTSKAALQNQFQVLLPGGDMATMYFTEDDTIAFLPSFANRHFVHVCYAKWDYSESNQKMTISPSDPLCKMLRGTFRVKAKEGRIHLAGKNKYFVLHYLPR